MSIRFRSQLNIDLMPDEQLDNRWEVMMPMLKIPMSESEFPKVGVTDYSGYPYMPTVEAIHFSPLGFKSTTNNRAVTNFYNVPSDKEDSRDTNITMYCDTGMIVQYYLAVWKKMVYNVEHEFYYQPWQYKKDIEVYFYGAGSVMPSAHFTLKGCYPTVQSDFELQYSRDPKRLRITQKFNVDRVSVDTKLAAWGALSTLTNGNPLGVLSDIGLSGLYTTVGVGSGSMEAAYNADSSLG